MREVRDSSFNQHAVILCLCSSGNCIRPILTPTYIYTSVWPAKV